MKMEASQNVRSAQGNSEKATFRINSTASHLSTTEGVDPTIR